jgi:hypothetical protein
MPPPMMPVPVHVVAARVVVHVPARIVVHISARIVVVVYGLPIVDAEVTVP